MSKEKRNGEITEGRERGYKQLLFHWLSCKDVRVSFRSGEDSHIQLIELILCPRKLSPSKETHRQAAELPEAELKGDSGKKSSIPHQGPVQWEGPTEPLRTCVWPHWLQEDMNTQAVLARESLTTNRKRYNSSDGSRECSSFVFFSCIPKEPGPEDKERDGV